MSVLLQTNQASKTFVSGKVTVEALKPTNLIIQSGEIVVITGKSGSGKSTLLNLLGGLMLPTAGDVFLEDVSLSTLSEKARTELRSQKIGFVFQSFHLIYELNVLNNMRLPFDISGKPYDLEYEQVLTDLLGIEQRLSFFPEELSGGERQRVAIARALLMRPALILADEPTGNLDVESGQHFMDLIRNANNALGQTFVIVTHDMEWLNYADRRMEMKDGVLEECKG